MTLERLRLRQQHTEPTIQDTREEMDAVADYTEAVNYLSPIEEAEWEDEDDDDDDSTF